MENQHSVSARDFFLHLGAIASLYAVAVSFVTLLFRVIDKAYPEISQYVSYTPSPNISLPVATLIIVFPIFILLSWLLEKSYIQDPSRKQLGIRKWLTYITLFLGGIILVGDLVTVLYKFLDGQNLTVAFTLKALVVFLTSGFVFGYYLQDIRDRILPNKKKVWAIGAGVVVVLAIILGFSIIGSPQTQRYLKYDEQRVADLQGVQWQIINIWQKRGELPKSISEIADPLSGFIVPMDPETGIQYEYNRTGTLTFQLCATFNLEAKEAGTRAIMPAEPVSKGSEYWDHTAGRQCFDRTIDPKLYPVVKQ